MEFTEKWILFLISITGLVVKINCIPLPLLLLASLGIEFVFILLEFQDFISYLLRRSKVTHGMIL